MIGVWDLPRSIHVPWVVSLNANGTFIHYLVLLLNGSKYYFMYTFNTVHILRILELGTYLPYSKVCNSYYCVIEVLLRS